MTPPTRLSSSADVFRRHTECVEDGDVGEYGYRLAKLTFDLGPHASRIENLAGHISQSNPSAGDLRGVQLRFKVVSGDGAVIVYTSSVDNGTADQVLRTQ